MAIIDKLLTLSDGQAVTGTVRSTNTVDLVSSARQIGKGHPVAAHFFVAPGATGGATFALRTADDAAFTTNVRVLGSTTFTAGELADGLYFKIGVPSAGVARYLEAYYTAGASTLTVTATLGDQAGPDWAAMEYAESGGA